MCIRDRYFTERYGNPSSVYGFAAANKEVISQQRDVIAQVLGAKGNEIYFTAGGSEADNWALTVSYTHLDVYKRQITNQFKGVDKSFAIQAGREIRVMVVPEQVSDADMVLMARDIAKQIEYELEYPGQIKVNVIRESRVTDYAK